MKKVFQSLKKIIDYVRSLKNKLTHDNLFDISLGAILALIGLWIYLNVADMDKLIIVVVPAFISWCNELLNKLQGAKFGWIDLFYRCVVGVILYFIV